MQLVAKFLRIRQASGLLRGFHCALRFTRRCSAMASTGPSTRPSSHRQNFRVQFLLARYTYPRPCNKSTARCLVRVRSSTTAIRRRSGVRVAMNDWSGM